MTEVIVLLLSIIATLTGAFLGLLAWFLRRELAKNDEIHQKLWNKMLEIHEKMSEYEARRLWPAQEKED